MDIASAVPGRRLGGRGRAPSSRREWCRAKFALQDFDHVNHCAYFDYQTGEGLPPHQQGGQESLPEPPQAEEAAEVPVNREVEIRSDTCPFCKGNRITRLGNKTRSPSSPTT